jgi:hypothetical protein
MCRMCADCGRNSLWCFICIVVVVDIATVAIDVDIDVAVAVARVGILDVDDWNHIFNRMNYAIDGVLLVFMMILVLVRVFVRYVVYCWYGHR